MLAHKKKEGAMQQKERRERRGAKITARPIPCIFTRIQKGGMVEQRVWPQDFDSATAAASVFVLVTAVAIRPSL